jgi:hypothetical protein
VHLCSNCHFSQRRSSNIAYRHGGRFPKPIRAWDATTGRERQLVDFADVLWNGFRCGILHEAHVPLYGRLWGVPAVFEFNVSGSSTYADTGAACPTVDLNPGPFADEVISAFNSFIHDLKGPDVQLRANFRKKFLVSYGIDIGNDP